MPIYEYKCHDCGKTTEILWRSSTQKIDLACSHCHSQNLTKIFSTPATVNKISLSKEGLTCCGQTERYSSPPCSNGTCSRDK